MKHDWKYSINTKSERGIAEALEYAEYLGREDRLNKLGSFTSDTRKDIAYFCGVGEWASIPVEHQCSLLVAYRQGEKHEDILRKANSIVMSAVEGWTKGDWENEDYYALVADAVKMINESPELLSKSTAHGRECFYQTKGWS